MVSRIDSLSEGRPVIRVNWVGAAVLGLIMIVFSVHGFTTGVTSEGVGFLFFRAANGGCLPDAPATTAMMRVSRLLGAEDVVAHKLGSR
jgi:hypothetical protein